MSENATERQLRAATEVAKAIADKYCGRDGAEPTGATGTITAAQIEKNCPDELIDLGNRINAHLAKAEKADQKANDHRIAAGQLLTQAEAACDDGGFKAFCEKFDVGRSRAYELKAIARGKKTIEEVRADTAERVRRFRDKEKAAEPSVTVTDEERDRKACVELNQKVLDAERERAQWLEDHPPAEPAPPKRPSKRPASKRIDQGVLSKEDFAFLANALSTLKILLGEMAKSDPTCARQCAEKITAQLNAAISKAIEEAASDDQPAALQ
jgi:hypothetical protein